MLELHACLCHGLNSIMVILAFRNCHARLAGLDHVVLLLLLFIQATTARREQQQAARERQSP